MKTTITKQQFFKDVKHEVETLKELATQDEINKLDFETFYPDSTERCIYGQMTGHCRSERASDLIQKACVRVTINDKDAGLSAYQSTFTRIKKKINGAYEDDLMRGELHYLSMIETYIFLKDGKPKNIIAYLKGEIETLEL